MSLYHKVSQLCSRITTEEYSTSFASAIRLLHNDLQKPIYNIYGFVRLADEVVDTFHEHDKELLLQELKTDTYEGIQRGISLNPILQSFQMTVNEFNIDPALIEAFFNSMEMDLNKEVYDEEKYSEYIYGSAEVVGLMCLYVFCEGDQQRYEELKPSAQSLGAAFQKVNFLRDVKADYNQLNRIYFPGVDFNSFSELDKQEIEANIAIDFEKAYEGIRALPWKARFGVYVAYKYYLSLFKKIRKVTPCRILEERIRIPNYSKAMILVRAGVKSKLDMI